MTYPNPQIYRDAAQLIEDHGWYHSENTFDEDIPITKTCAAMSIVDAGGFGSILEAFATFIGWDGDRDYYGYITKWNDAQRSATIVTAKLREFADTLGAT